MEIKTGKLTPFSLGYAVPNYYTYNLEKHLKPYFGLICKTYSLANQGSKIFNLPSIVKSNVNGIYSLAFSDLYYNRIYITPNPVGLGQLLTTKVINMEIWNAYRGNQNLTEIEPLDAEGIQFGLDPGVFKALESKTFPVTITTTGPANIGAKIILHFNSRSYTISFLGSRLVVFSLSPDWQDGITERISYLIQVIQAYDDTEQRIQLREKPKKSYEFRISTLGPQETSFLDALLFNWQARVFGVPIWTDAQIPGQDIPQGAVTIFVKTQNYNFRAGALALIYQDFLNFEVVEINSVSGEYVTLVKPTISPWPKNKVLVLPLEKGRLPETIDLLKPTSTQTEAKIAFELEVI